MNEVLKRQKYLVVEQIISPEMADVFARYAKAHREYHFQGGDPQAPRSHSVWGDFLMESLLSALQPKLENLIGLRLCPTYAFYRVYVPNEALLPHKDRPACEVSCSLCLGFDYRGRDYKWRIKMGQKSLAMQPGDGVIYLGCEIEHSRPPLLVPEDGWHAQAFLHYVDRDGPNRDQEFDGRQGLYEPRVK